VGGDDPALEGMALGGTAHEHAGVVLVTVWLVGGEWIEHTASGSA